MSLTKRRRLNFSKKVVISFNVVTTPIWLKQSLKAQKNNCSCTALVGANNESVPMINYFMTWSQKFKIIFEQIIFHVKFSKVMLNGPRETRCQNKILFQMNFMAWHPQSCKFWPCFFGMQRIAILPWESIFEDVC